MPTAESLLDRQFLEMRWRCLSLAADIDRLQRSDGGNAILSDSRIVELREAMRIIMSPEPARAQRVQMLFSDHTPPPTPNRK